MSILSSWKIEDIERTANEALRRTNEMDALRSNVDRLECAVREACANTVGVRIELQACQEKMSQLEARLDVMEAVV